MDQYTYNGPVLEFDRVIADNWSAKTWAPTERKARSNLMYQFKKQFNKVASTKITLPGKITRLGQEKKIS